LERIEEQIRIYVSTKYGGALSSDVRRKFPTISERNIFLHLKKLRETGDLNYGKIRGYGKRLRYSIPDEEIIKNDIWIRAVQFVSKGHKGAMKANYPPSKNEKYFILVNGKITQTQLSKMISDERKSYRKEFTKTKKEPYDNFVHHHIAMASHCMTWILQLTWAINADVFSESDNKLKRAYRNKERFEDHLHTIIYNLKERDKEQFKRISSIIYNKLTHMPLIDTFYPEMIPPYELAIPKAKPLH